MEGILAQILASVSAMQATNAGNVDALKNLFAGLGDGLKAAATEIKAAAEQLSAATTELKAAAAGVTPAKVAENPAAGGELAAGADTNALLGNLLGQALVKNLTAGNDGEQANDLGGLLVGLLTKGGNLSASALGGGGFGDGTPVRRSVSPEIQQFIDNYASDLQAGADGKFTIAHVNAAVEKAKAAGRDTRWALSVKNGLLAAGLVSA